MKRWKDTHFLVSADGRVWSEKRNRYMGTLDKRGYIRVNGTRAHNMVMEVYGSPRPPGDYVIDHINEDKTDNRIENLRWITRSHNARRSIMGENSPRAKLTWEQVTEIRELYARGNITKTRLGELYGVHRKTIRQIIEHKKWLVPV